MTVGRPRRFSRWEGGGRKEEKKKGPGGPGLHADVARGHADGQRVVFLIDHACACGKPYRENSGGRGLTEGRRASMARARRGSGGSRKSTSASRSPSSHRSAPPDGFSSADASDERQRRSLRQTWMAERPAFRMNSGRREKWV
jgi:hypothetical protein